MTDKTKTTTTTTKVPVTPQEPSGATEDPTTVVDTTKGDIVAPEPSTPQIDPSTEVVPTVDPKVTPTVEPKTDPTVDPKLPPTNVEPKVEPIIPVIPPTNVDTPTDPSTVDISNIAYEVVGKVEDQNSPKSLVTWEIKLTTKDEGLDLGTVKVQQALDGLDKDTLAQAMETVGVDAARGAAANPNFEVMQEIAKTQKGSTTVHSITELKNQLSLLTESLNDLHEKVDMVQQDQATLGAWAQAIYAEVTK